MKQHHNPHRPAAALLLWWLLFLIPYFSKAQFSIVTTNEQEKPLVGKKGVFNCVKNANKVKIKIDPQLIDSVKNINNDNTLIGFHKILINKNIDVVKKAKCKINKEYQICKLEITIVNATDYSPKMELMGYIEDIFLPQNSFLTYYTSNGKQMVKTITADMAKNYFYKARKFPILPLKSNSITIEYKVPVKYKKDIIININTLYCIKNIVHDSYRLQSLPPPNCFADITCPEGYCWHNESNGIAYVQNVVGSSYGTGTLINTTEGNKKVYFFTGYHVINPYNDPQNDIFIYFKFKSNGCNLTTTYTTTTLFVKSIVASSSLTDFALLELQPDNYEYTKNDFTFVGWNRDSLNVQNVSSIHHPDDPNSGGPFPTRIVSTITPITTNQHVIYKF